MEAPLKNRSPCPNEAKREEINRWIRTSGAYDAVIDFDKVVCDPKHPSSIRQRRSHSSQRCRLQSDGAGNRLEFVRRRRLL